MRIRPIVAYSILTLILSGILKPGTFAIQTPEDPSKTIKIGLLVQDNKSYAARQGAELAVLKANKSGGYHGKQFRLVTRSMEGAWGTGSEQTVDFIFQENVCAILGSHDGRNAHLVEQVCTKARIVFLSAWAGDPTLAQAFVPWYFSCVPNNLQQADAFIDEIYTKRKFTRVAAVSDKGYDSKLALNSFMKRTKIAGTTDPIQFSYDNPELDLKSILNQIKNAEIQAIVLFGSPSASSQFIKLMKQSEMRQTVVGTLLLNNEEELSPEKVRDLENILTISAVNWSGEKGHNFSEEYKKQYGKFPGAVAAYSYDATCMLIEAVRSTGTDREEIQKKLAKMHFEGVTGPIQFDEKGKRTGMIRLEELKNCIAPSVEH
jgi:branched-chain amino acid transport system substrate-binding protein